MSGTTVRLADLLRARVMDPVEMLRTRPEGLTRAEQGRSFIGYELWRVPSALRCLEAKLFRDYRAGYFPTRPAPLVMECLPPSSIPPGSETPEEPWDRLALSLDRTWRGEWEGVPAVKQPGLVILRTDGAAVMSPAPAGLGPALAALVCYPLVSADEISLCARHLGAPEIDTVARSQALIMFNRQGLLLKAPKVFADVHQSIMKPGLSRTRGGQSKVYLSLPAYALAKKDQPNAEWESNPTGVLEDRMRDAAEQLERQMKRWKALVSRLRAAGVRSVWNQLGSTRRRRK